MCTVGGNRKGGEKLCVCVWVCGWRGRSDSKKQGEQGSRSERRDKKEREETPAQTAEG